MIAPGALRERPLCQAGPAAAATGATLRRSGALEIRAGPAAEPSAGGKPALRVFASVPDLAAPWARHRLYDWRTASLPRPPRPILRPKIMMKIIKIILPGGWLCL